MQLAAHSVPSEWTRAGARSSRLEAAFHAMRQLEDDTPYHKQLRRLPDALEGLWKAVDGSSRLVSRPVQLEDVGVMRCYAGRLKQLPQEWSDPDSVLHLVCRLSQHVVCEHLANDHEPCASSPCPGCAGLGCCPTAAHARMPCLPPLFRSELAQGLRLAPLPTLVPSVSSLFLYIVFVVCDAVKTLTHPGGYGELKCWRAAEPCTLPTPQV